LAFFLLLERVFFETVDTLLPSIGINAVLELTIFFAVVLFVAIVLVDVDELLDVRDPAEFLRFTCGFLFGTFVTKDVLTTEDLQDLRSLTDL